MENPFTPDTIPFGGNFIGRKHELLDLEQRILSSDTQRLLLLAPRRVGKTSLALNLINKLQKQKHCCIYIDIFSATSTADFANILLEGIIKGSNLSALNKIGRWVNENLLKLRASLKISTNYQGDISLEPLLFKSSDSALKKIEEALTDLEEIGSKQKVLLVIDEFQNILEWDHQQKLEKHLRGLLQKFKNLNIIFLGSQVNLLQTIFTDKQRAFYRQVNIIPLESVDSQIQKKWIKKSFLKTKISISDEVIDQILEISKINIQQVQYICFELWNQCQLTKTTTINITILSELITKLINREKTHYERLWVQLTKSQKKFLKALAQVEILNNPQSQDFLAACSLASSTARDTLVKLEEQYIVVKDKDQYYINDGLFQKWIAP